MRCTPMYKLLSLVVMFLVALGLNAQSIDPSKQIDWTRGPIPNMLPAMTNGIPQVASFNGSDACGKLHNAMVYAIANSFPMVDATSLIGTQACATNPFLNLTSGTSNIGTSVSMTVLFGTTHFQTAVPWVIVNSGITLKGSPYGTLLDYTGASCTGTPSTCAALILTTDSGTGTPAEQGGPNGIVVDGMYILGGTSNLTDGIILQSSRSSFRDIHVWGVVGCGIHTKGATSNTITHPVVSNIDATLAGVISGRTAPANGLCMDQDTVFGVDATTSTTVTDPIMEGLSGIGIHLIKANNIVVTGGTSESNGGGGIVIDTGTGVINKQNTFIGIDLEGNGNDLSANGYDVQDNGQLNTYINILATSHCNATCHSVNLVGGGSQYVLGGQLGDLVNNTGVGGGGANGIPVPGATTGGATAGSGTLPSNPLGFIIEEVQGVSVRVPYYNP